MADLAASSWTELDNNNNSAAPNGWLSGSMVPSSVEPTARAGMGALKRWHNQISPVYTTTGSANAQVLTHSVGKAALVAGDMFSFIAGFSNTGATTLNVDGLGAKNVVIGSTALAGAEILSGTMVTVGYDGTQFQLANSVQLINGTWTPTLLFGGTNVGMTYSGQGGSYYRLGKLTYVAFDFTVTAKGSSTGQASIGGLPFYSNSSVWEPVSMGFYFNLSGAGSGLACYIPASGNSITLAFNGASTVANLADTNFLVGARLSGSATYISA